MSLPAYFVSDLHLGTRYAGARQDRAEKFERFVEGLQGRASRLFLLGDLFEFWMEYRHFIPKAQFGVLAALRNLRKSGVPIDYLAGNHDFNLGTFFRDELGIETHDGPLSVELQGKRVLLLHGDGMNPGDKAYRVVKGVLRHPLSNWAWKKIHPDLGMRIALGVGKTSRDQHHGMPRHLDRYEAEARRLMREGKHDILMHGHVHAGFVKRVPEGVYVNTGEWVKRLEYVEMRDGDCVLKTYED
jgi:UDP-2,3-diacylglucosamine hydrolase